MRAIKLFLILLTGFVLSASTVNIIHVSVQEPRVAVVSEPLPKLQLPTQKTISASIVTTKPPVVSDRPKEDSPKSPGPATGDWQSVFNSMKSKLPGTYIVADKGSWGATDLSSGTVYIAPRTPLKYLDDVMLHESVHVRQGRVYGNISSARSALAPFGGLEPVADCGAKMLGATWTNYVKSCTSDMNHAARAMLAGIPA
jgi:hypothetical protein